MEKDTNVVFLLYFLLGTDGHNLISHCEDYLWFKPLKHQQMTKFGLNNMGLVRKPNLVACKHQRRRSVGDAQQSDQRLCYSLSRKYTSPTSSMQNFNIPANLCSWADVGKPRRQVFSRHGPFISKRWWFPNFLIKYMMVELKGFNSDIHPLILIQNGNLILN